MDTGNENKEVNSSGEDKSWLLDPQGPKGKEEYQELTIPDTKKRIKLLDPNNTKLFMIVLIIAATVIISLVYVAFNYEKIFLDDNYDLKIITDEHGDPIISSEPVPSNPSEPVTTPPDEPQPTQPDNPTPGQPDNPQPVEVYVESISLDGCNNLLVGNSETITAYINPSNANDKTINWTSSNPVVASITDGKVTAKSAGTTIITAYNPKSNVKGMCSITVSNTQTPTPQEIPVSYISLSGCNSLSVGSSETIIANISPSNANDKSIIWSSSNTNIATILNGKLTARAAGTTTITAKNSKSGISGSCNVTVKAQPPAEVLVSSISLTGCNNLNIGNSETISAYISPSNATDKSITWTSSNSSVVSISNGVATAKSAGTATITAYNPKSGRSGSCSITVNKPQSQNIDLPVSSISLSGCNNLTVGGSETITATISPLSATDKSIIWTTSNSSIASISNGTVTAKSAGTVTITATNPKSGKSGSCSIKVTNPSAQINVEYYFLSGADDNNNHSQAIIMKTKGGKYVLLDTGLDTAANNAAIVNTLKKLQGVSKPVIDYLIISHAHSDHAGGIKRLAGKVTVKQYIAKDTRYGEKVSSKIANNLGGTRKTITSEGQEIKVDDDLILRFYNIGDYYSNKSCSDNVQLWLRAPKPDGSTNSDFDKFTVDGKEKYIYIKGKEFRKGTYKYYTSDTIIQETNISDHMDYNFYFSIKSSKYYSCDENANSYVILAKTPNSSGNEKYAYFPSDVENVGYSIFPDSNNIMGAAYTASFASKPKFTTGGANGGHFSSVASTSNQAPAETTTANYIKNYLGSNLNKIVIYQSSHHGYNNVPSVISTLGLNRSSVYSITSIGISPTVTKNFSQIRSYYYALGNTKRLNTGTYASTNGGGVYCYIKSNGDYSCKTYNG